MVRQEALYFVRIPFKQTSIGWLQNYFVLPFCATRILLDVILNWVVSLGREFFPDSKNKHREHPRSKWFSKGGGILVQRDNFSKVKQ